MDNKDGIVGIEWLTKIHFNWATPILWHLLEKGGCKLKLFGGINISLVVVFHARIYTSSQIVICGPQHHSPKGFHAPCGDVIGPVIKIITKYNYVWIFGGIMTP
jgi:hypothetical protein